MGNRILPLTLVAAISSGLTGSVYASPGDGVHALCVDRKNEEICRCATEKLQAGLGPDDFSVYDDIGVQFAKERDAGKAYVPAWDAASEAASADMGIPLGELRQRTNSIGRAHAKAIKACGD